MKTNVFFDGIQEQIIKHINVAKREIIIAVAWFTDPVIISALCSKIKRDRIDVKILIYKDKINKKDLYLRLYNNGAEVKFSEIMMHNKFCVIDKFIVVNGSYNWTQKANHNNENIQISYDNEVLSSAFVKEFNRLFSRATNYKHYIIQYDNARTKILYHLKSFLPQYKQLFKKPDKYPCFIVFHNSDIEKKGGVILRLGVGEIENYIYILIKNEFCWNSIVEELFMFLVENRFLKMPSCYSKEECAEEYSKMSEEIKGIENKFLINKGHIRIYNQSICSKLLFNIYRVNKKYISDDEFIVNGLICHYIYWERKEKFVAVKLNLDERGFVRYDKNTLIGLVNMDGVLEKTIIDGRFVEKENEYLFNESARIIYVFDNCLTEVSIPNGYIPDFLICNHIVLKKSRYYGGVCYNIMNYSGELYFINDESYNCFCDYVVKNEYLIEFKWSGYNANITIDLRTNTMLDPSNVLGDQKREIIQKRRDIEREKRGNNCYIATMVYKDINHPNVCILRAFRDRTLINYKIGRFLISYYYKYSPSWVEFLRDKKMINSIIKFVLNRFVFIICLLYRMNFNSVENSINN